MDEPLAADLAAAPEAAPAAGNEALPEKNFDALIERWWADHFPGSAVAAYTQAWNIAFSAKEALKAMFARAARGGG